MEGCTFSNSKSRFQQKISQKFTSSKVWVLHTFGLPSGAPGRFPRIYKKILKNEHRASTRVKNVISKEAILAKKWGESTKKYFCKMTLRIQKAAGPPPGGPPFKILIWQNTERQSHTPWSPLKGLADLACVNLVSPFKFRIIFCVLNLCYVSVLSQIHA